MIGKKKYLTFRRHNLLAVFVTLSNIGLLITIFLDKMLLLLFYC